MLFNIIYFISDYLKVALNCAITVTIQSASQCWYAFITQLG